MLFTFALSLIQLLLITHITFKEYNRRSVSVFLWAMLFLLFGVMHFLTILSFDYEYPIWVYNNASIFVILFCIVYSFTRKISMRQKLSIHNIDWESSVSMSSSQKKYVYITFCILIFCTTYQIIDLLSFSGVLMDSSWSTMIDSARSKELGMPQILSILEYSTASIILFIYNKQRKLAIISALFVFSMAIIYRERAALLPLLTVAINYFIYQNKKISTKRIILFGLLGLISIILIYFLQIFRYYGSIGNFMDLFSIQDFQLRLSNQLSENRGDLWLKDIFYYFIYNDNNFENFEKGHTYLRMLLIGIPTSLSGGIKPPDFAVSMGTAMGMPIGGSVHPTLFGDCFANFGYLGVLWGIFWGIYVKLIDKIANRKDTYIKLSLIILHANAFILIGRGSVYNAYGVAFGGTIVIGIIYLISKARIRIIKTYSI